LPAFTERAVFMAMLNDEIFCKMGTMIFLAGEIAAELAQLDALQNFADRSG
jgi:hypothetical protein